MARLRIIRTILAKLCIIRTIRTQVARDRGGQAMPGGETTPSPCDGQWACGSYFVRFFPNKLSYFHFDNSKQCQFFCSAKHTHGSRNITKSKSSPKMMKQKFKSKVKILEKSKILDFGRFWRRRRRLSGVKMIKDKYKEKDKK